MPRRGNFSWGLATCLTYVLISNFQYTWISGEVIGFGRAAADMHLLFFFATFTSSFVKLLAGFWRLNNIFDESETVILILLCLYWGPVSYPAYSITRQRPD